MDSNAFIAIVQLLRQSAVTRESRKTIKNLLRGPVWATFMVDGYETASNTHILGAVIRIGPERFILDAKEEGYKHHDVATANEIASVIDNLDRDGYLPIECVCTDDAGQCGRARRILTLRYPKLIFLRC